MSVSITCKPTSGHGGLYAAATLLFACAVGCTSGSAASESADDDEQPTDLSTSAEQDAGDSDRDHNRSDGAITDAAGSSTADDTNDDVANDATPNDDTSDDADAGNPNVDAPNDDATNDAGDSAAPTPSNADCGHAIDGERLEVTRLVGDDGSWEATGWYDTLFEQRCVFFQATDGVDRCMPFDQTVALATPLRYLDAECTQPIAVDPGGECDPAGRPRFLFVTETIDACPAAAQRPFELGDDLGAPDTVYALLEDGTCLPQQSVSLDGTAPDVYEVLEEVRPEDMVSARYEARGERMQDSYLVASDGASARIRGPYDTANNSDCGVDLAGDGTWRCLPAAISAVSYTDAECAQPAVRAPMIVGCAQSQDVFEESNHFALQRDLLSGDPAGCPNRTSIFQLWDLAQTSEATALYSVDSLDADMCVGSTLVTPIEVVSATASPPDSFSRASLEHGECDATASSGTRLKRQNMVFEDGYRVSGSFFDSELGDTCHAALAADGVLRCLPGETSRAQGYFADAACTRAAAAVARPCPIGLDESQRVAPHYVQQSVGLAQCQPMFEIYELGPELSDVYELAVSGDPESACVVADVTSWTDTMFKEILSPIPASSLVSLTHSH